MTPKAETRIFYKGLRGIFCRSDSRPTESTKVGRYAIARRCGTLSTEHFASRTNAHGLWTLTFLCGRKRRHVPQSHAYWPRIPAGNHYSSLMCTPLNVAYTSQDIHTHRRISVFHSFWTQEVVILDGKYGANRLKPTLRNRF